MNDPGRLRPGDRLHVHWPGGGHQDVRFASHQDNPGEVLVRLIGNGHERVAPAAAVTVIDPPTCGDPEHRHAGPCERWPSMRVLDLREARTEPCRCPWHARLRAELDAGHAEMMAACTCPGNHDDESECPVSPPCTCREFFDPFCPRHGDPSYP